MAIWVKIQSLIKCVKDIRGTLFPYRKYSRKWEWGVKIISLRHAFRRDPDVLIICHFILPPELIYALQIMAA
jgi:hypothetical protein